MQSDKRRKPLAVAFLTDLLEMGGAEVQLVDLVSTLDPRRVRAEVAVLQRRAELCDRIIVPTVAFGMRLPGDPRVLWALGRWIRRGAFDAVYTNHVWATIMTAWLRGRGGPRGFAWAAAQHSFRRPGASRLLEPLRLQALRRADRLVAVSELQAEWLRGYVSPTPPIAVIPNAIDVERFAAPVDGSSERRRLGIPAGVPVIVSVGRLVEVKGHDILIDALALCAAARKPPDAHLVLVGAGPEQAALTARVAAAHLVERVHFAGLQPDPRPLLAAADLFCLASRSEAMCIAIIEAMGAGLPVVATRVGGNPEVVADGETGRLVPPEDPGALARALGELLAQPDLRRRYGEAGRARARAQFEIHARAERITALLEELVARETNAGAAP
jgi:glycosyltransferase involved in cell wall biosynthesis